MKLVGSKIIWKWAAICVSFVCPLLFVMLLLALIARQSLERAVVPVASPAMQGAALAAATADGAIMQWRGARLANTIAAHDSPVTSILLSADGAELVSADARGSVRLSRRTPLTQLQFSEAVWSNGAAGVISSVSEFSLWAVSQVVPLTIPPSRAGFPHRRVRDCEKCPDMIEIEPGLLFMGAMFWERPGGPARTLTPISVPFALGRFAITFDEWDACYQEKACPLAEDNGWGRGRRPVINITWDDAQSYATWLSGKTKQRYRLATDLEREFATRAGAASPYWWGWSAGEGRAHCANCVSPPPTGTIPVDAYEPNPLGLYQAHGNVWEWTSTCDLLESRAASASNTSSGKDCRARRLSGGAWNSLAADMRSWVRRTAAPETRGPDIGLRIARDIALSPKR